MNRIRHRLLAGIALVIVLGAAGGCAVTPIRQHPDFASQARKVQTVAVLPPDVEYVRIVFNGDNERLTEKEQAIAAELSRGFEATLRSKQYTVRAWPEAAPGEASGASNFDLQQVRTAYNEAAKQLYEKNATEEESKTYRVSLGPVVNPVATAVDAEGLLYVRYYGFEKSGGQQTKDVIAGALLGVLTGTVVVPAAEGAAMEIALIDGTSGDVLWSNRGNNASLGMGAPKMAEKILAQLPGKETAVASSDASAAAAAAPVAATPAQ